MVLRVRQRQRLGGGGDQADEALAGAHRRQMHGLAIEAFGGEQLERPVGARDIERAHLGDHVGGDQDDDAVEARLCGDGLRHDLAEPSKQKSGSARRAHPISRLNPESPPPSPDTEPLKLSAYRPRPSRSARPAGEAAQRSVTNC